MKRLSIVLLFAATAALPAAAQLGGPPIELTEHPYAKKGDWEVRWFTDSRGAFVHADMIRSYENGTALRLVWGKDLNAVDFFGPTQEIVEAGRAEVTWYFDNPDPGTVMANTAVIHPDNNGDLWLRINQRTDEPGVEDALSNAGSVTFHSGTNVWKFDLKGSNAAYKAFLDCFHQQTGAGGTAPAPTTTVPAPAPGPAMAPAGGGTVPAGAGVPGEHSYATVGDWRVTFVNDNTGAFSRAVATRHYANSTSLRVVVGKGFQTIDYYGDFSAVQTDRIQIACHFDRVNLTHQAVAELYAENGDTWLRVSLPDEASIGESLANSDNVTFQSGSVTWAYNLQGSRAALESLVRCYSTFSSDRNPGGATTTPAPATTIPAPGAAPATVPAPATIPAPGAAPRQMNPAAQAPAAAAERIEFDPAAPSIRWDVTVPIGQSKHYVIPTRRGQKLTAKFLEDTRKGIVDFGRYSLEEGLDLGLEMTVDQDTDYDLFLTNPTAGPLIFTFFLTRE